MTAKEPVQQLGLVCLGAAMAVAMVVAAYGAFMHAADVNGYLQRAEHVRDVMRSADTSLGEMIRNNEVTWDPSNGTSATEALAHMKRTDKPRLLLVGSSDLLVVSDDWTGTRVPKRVDRAIKRLASHSIEVYNFAKTAMTVDEAELVLERATEIQDFDWVVSSLLLWNCQWRKVSHGIAALRTESPGAGPVSAPGTPWGTALSPAALNRRIGEWTESWGEACVPPFRRRLALQQWLFDVFTGQERQGASSAGPGGVKPDYSVEYVYPTFSFSDAAKQDAARGAARDLIGYLAGLHARKGTRVALLLPPYRHDDRKPLYGPEGFYAEWAGFVRSTCQEQGVMLLDAGDLLEPRHFEVVDSGQGTIRVDSLHFDAAGHTRLAEFLIRSLAL